MTPRLAAVTGATGFLGGRLVPALIGAGWRVRVLCRRDPDPAFWEGAAPQIVRGDLDDAAALDRLCEGAEVVIHGAGLIKAMDLAGFLAVNEAGSARVAAAARTAGARLLAISSLAAREPALSDYAASKAAGEAAARAAFGEALSVLRPPAIYGPGDRETLALFRLAATSSLLPLPGDPAARLALAHVDDVCAEVLRLAEAPTPGTWAVGGERPQGYAWREVFQTAAAVFGRRIDFVPVGPTVLRAAGALSAFGGRLTGQPAIFGPGKVRELLHTDWSVSPAEQAPGAAPARFDLAAGFAATVAWYRAAGWL
ncbi:NAD-dependent epimerase/dehydratase family protein [Caulobacter sp. KR2-114]|uniref:NAD-dependent epimerase/dehydratase family protein n=1 Tax=Caulobacter sp. KR2-114 TaxID=3400912 RepID=UPI003C12417A